MKKNYAFLLCLFLSFHYVQSQNWIWSKALPSYPGLSMVGYLSKESGQNYFMYISGYAAPPESKFIIIDDTGTVTDSLHLNMIPEKFQVDDSGNLVLCGTYTDSISYGGATIHSRGGEDIYVLRIAFNGSLIFLKNLGSPDTYDRLASMTTDRFNKIYLCFNLPYTMYIDADSIPNHSVDEACILILNPDGSVNSSITRVLPTVPVGYYYASRVFLGRNDEIYMGIGNCYPNECSESVCEYSALHDSVDYFANGLGAWGTRNVDDAGENAYTFTNPASHYYWAPILHKYSLVSRTELWSKSLGSMYSPYCLNPILLPGNVILNYGRGGGDDGGAGPATLDDTTFTFGNETEMLMALMDTSGHFYYTVNAKVQKTAFINAGYDMAGNAYLLSSWSSDTTYTIGTTFTISSTPSNPGYVLSKLKYMETATGIASAPGAPEIGVYPNPSGGMFTIRTGMLNEEGKLRIYDVLGNCILTRTVSKQPNVEIDLSEHAKGVYFIEINTRNERFNKKVVVN